MAGEEEVEFNSNREGYNGGNLTRTRIYVGGLGGTVTEDDLRKTFSPLGKLESIEIIRTKNRSIAYLDFLPSSDKSLAKLFSTYNGCLWKGGRLKLEKAKEHYLVRLKHEWVEEAQLKSNASNTNVSENKDSIEKPKKVRTVESPQLRFFFPKLMKMKSLPFTGTGKHKYSFQRVEVPPLPVHFCDCEEHAHPSDAFIEKPSIDLESKQGGINERELDMMNSVMNKLFSKENHPKIIVGESQLAKGGGNLSNSIADDMHVDENEIAVEADNETDAVSDEDNLVINIVAGGSDSSVRKQKIIGYQESNFNKQQTSKQKATQKTPVHEKKKITPYDKKRKSPLIAESEGNEMPSFAPKLKKISKEPVNQATCTERSTHSVSCCKRSGWKNLVGKSKNTQFSISQILPNVPSSKEEQSNNNNNNFVESNSTEIKEKEFNNNKNNFVESNSTEIEEEKLLKRGNSETQVDLLNEVKEPEINNDGNLGSQLSPSKAGKEFTGAAAVVPSAVSSSTSGRGAAWKQKSSWTQLISNTTASSFSISQVLPGLNFESQGVMDKPYVIDPVKPKNNEVKNNLEAASSKPITSDPCEFNMNTLAKEKKIVEGPNVDMMPNVVEKNEKRSHGGEIWNGEMCPFMRSEASMKEWMKTKAALSSSLKKKGNEKLIL